MTILTWALVMLLIVAAAWIVVQHLTHWLERRDGLTIRFVVEDDGDH